jgi:type II secretory pathway predicted ATPase ExeA
MHYTMEPLEKEESKGYIEHNLQAAGAKFPLFSEEAIEAISSLSQMIFLDY